VAGIMQPVGIGQKHADPTRQINEREDEGDLHVGTAKDSTGAAFNRPS